MRWTIIPDSHNIINNKAGDLSDALLIQWRSLKAAETAMYAAGKSGDIKATLRAVHAITQASTAYAWKFEPFT